MTWWESPALPAGGLVLVLALWARQRARRTRRPFGPVIHRDELEEAEREVRGMRAEERTPVDDHDDWGPGAPRPFVRL